MKGRIDPGCSIEALHPTWLAGGNDVDVGYAVPGYRKHIPEMGSRLDFDVPPQAVRLAGE